MSRFVLLYFNIQACRLFCCSRSLQSRSLSYAKKTVKNFLTPGDTCLKKYLGFVYVEVDPFLSGRGAARPPYSPISVIPQDHPGSLFSHSRRLCPAHRAGAVPGRGDPGGLSLGRLVPAAPGAVARSPRAASPVPLGERHPGRERPLRSRKQHNPHQGRAPETLLLGPTCPAQPRTGINFLRIR